MEKGSNIICNWWLNKKKKIDAILEELWAAMTLLTEKYELKNNLF